MTIISAVTSTYPRLAADWLKHETDRQIGRDNAIVKAGAGKLVTGTVMGQITATKKWVPVDLAASDGSQTAKGILIDYVDASGASDVKGVVLVGNAEVVLPYLTWHASFDTLLKKQTAMALLAAQGIKTRPVA